MIEVQIHDIKVYEKLKSFASYSSDITHVCAFRDSLNTILVQNGVVIPEGQISDVESNPVLTIVQKKVMSLNDASPEMLHFIGVRSEFDPTIPVANMDRVHALLKNGLVQADESFKSLYSKLGYRNHISDLICSNIRFYGKGRLTDFIDGDLTIQSMKFNQISEKRLVYKQMDVQIDSTSDQGRTLDARCYQMAKDGTRREQKLVIRFYSKSNVLRSVLFPGNVINIACSKIGQSGVDLVTFDPIILPKGLMWNQDVMISPPNRSVPVQLYRNAYYEFMCRYTYDEWCESKGVKI